MGAPQRRPRLGVDDAAVERARVRLAPLALLEPERLADEDVLALPDPLGADARVAEEVPERPVGVVGHPVPAAHADLADEPEREHELDAGQLGQLVERVGERDPVPDDLRPARLRAAPLSWGRVGRGGLRRRRAHRAADRERGHEREHAGGVGHDGATGDRPNVRVRPVRARRPEG